MTSAASDAGKNKEGVSQERGYQEAMAHMQRAEWPDAIRELEKLPADHPGSAAIGEALEEARLRAQFDATTKVKPKRFVYPWKRTAIRTGLILAILFGLWQVTRSS